MTIMGVQEYACNYLSACPYAILCSSTNCEKDCHSCGGKSNVELLNADYDTHCRPLVVDRCFKHGPHFDYWECKNGLLWKNFHFKRGCGDTIWGYPTAQCGTRSVNNKWWYWNVDCNPHFIEPG